MRGKVGLLAHEPLLYRELTGRENLRFQARLHRVAPERIDELLERPALGRRADEPVRTLSRGMVQRMAVARAVLHDPRAAAARRAAREPRPAAIDLVEPLIGRSGRTRVITSHDPAGGLAEADVALGLRGGRTALLAEADQVTERDIGALYR